MRARKAVITAAGRGTRMFPATRSLQKELLPLVDRDGITKPQLQIILEECRESGIESVCIVVERGGEAPFREHFRPLSDSERRVFAGKDWALAQADFLADMAERITYVEQPSPEGFGHAVYQAREWVGEEPFLLLLGDHVYSAPVGIAPCIAQMLNAGEAEGGSVTGLRLDSDESMGRTGIVKCQARNPALAANAPGQTYDILALQEKPTPAEAREHLVSPGMPPGEYLGHFGLHLFTADIFACLGALIEKNLRVKNEFQLTSAQEILLARALAGNAPPYRALFVNGDRWDIGVPQEYLRTIFKRAQQGPFAAELAAEFGLKPL